jgi:hypothetical protein
MEPETREVPDVASSAHPTADSLPDFLPVEEEEGKEEKAGQDRCESVPTGLLDPRMRPTSHGEESRPGNS